MKTSNVFTIEGTTVKAQIFTAPEVRGEKDFKPELLWEADFDSADIPALLTDGDGFKSLAAYGLASLMQDRAASYNDKALAELNATFQARADRYVEVFGMLKDGVFSERKKGGGGASAGVDTFFAQALANVLQSMGKDVDATTATAMLQAMPKEQRDALKKQDAVAAEYAKVKAAAKEAAAAIDLSSLFA